MDKIRRVAIAEYLNSVRSKAFVISVLMVPLIVAGSVALQIYAQKKTDMSPRKFAVVDGTGRLFDAIEKAAEVRNSNLETAPKQLEKFKQIIPARPEFAPSRCDGGGREREALELELSGKVRKKELFAFVIIDKGVFSLEPEETGGVAYFTQTPTFAELPGWIERTINNEVRRARLQEAGMDSGLIGKLSRRASFERRGLAKKSKSGKFEKAKKENRLKTFAVPFVSMFLMFITVMTSAPMLMNTVLEEKMNKVSEVLISAVSPFQLMLGKLLGCVLVSLTLSSLYLGSILWSLHRIGYFHFVPLEMLGWFFLFQVMALGIFGSIFLAVGSACNEIRDAQSLMAPVMIMAMVPMFVWGPILQSPNSPFSQVMSLIPPFTPMLMMIRMAAPPGPAVWEIVLALVLTGLFMLFCIWAAAKIFRIGILAQGQSPSLFRLISWLWSK
jgi:ABC-2 type transport system permease protein